MSRGTVKDQLAALDKQMETAPIEHWAAIAKRRNALMERTAPATRSAVRARRRRVVIEED